MAGSLEGEEEMLTCILFTGFQPSLRIILDGIGNEGFAADFFFVSRVFLLNCIEKDYSEFCFSL